MASQTPELDYEIPPFLRIYKDGTVERLRGTDILPPSIHPETGVQSKDVVVTPETGVSARLYMPKTTNPDQKLPLLVYFHGGAFLVQTPFSPMYHNFLNPFVAEANVITVSLDYRRAPEHPLPTAHDDSWAALKWVASHSINGGGGGNEAWLKDYVDFDRVFLFGDSAGANIVHNMAIRVGSEGLEGMKLEGIVLLHPYFWGKDPIDGEIAEIESRGVIDKWWGIAGEWSSSGCDHPLINPVADPRLSSVGLGCPRVLICVAEKDIFKHRGWYYYEELRKIDNGCRSGVVVEMLESEGEEHIFFLKNPDTEKTVALVKRLVSFILSME